MSSETISFLLDKDNYIDLFNFVKEKKIILESENKKKLLKYTFNKLIEEYKQSLKDHNSNLNINVYKQFEKIKYIFEDMHGCYSEYNSDNVKNICYNIYKNKQNNTGDVTITMTSCKRLDLFQRTVNSFLECCQDLNLIKEWIVIDDNSDTNDKEIMKNLYPFITFVFKNKHEKGHVKSMNILKNIINTTYFFNIEDDWEFFYKDNYLIKCINVLKIDDNYGQCLINKNYGEGSDCFDTIGGILKYYVQSDLNKQFFFEHQFIQDKLEIQKEFLKYTEINNNQILKNQYYWPHFSFRVGMTKTSILKEIGNFNEVVHFEMEYAYRYVSKKYKTTFLDSIYCSHIGRRTSERFNSEKLNAYDLNKVDQFGVKKIIKNKLDPECNNESNNESNNIIDPKVNINKLFKTIMVNLKRRPDRLRNFFDKNKHILPHLDIEIEEAIDGDQIVLNQKKRRIFHTSDTQFRRGIMGCAFSHIKIWEKLANDKENDIYLVLEDDITITKGAEIILSQLPGKMNEIFPDWDVLFLGYHVKNNEITDKNKITIEKYNPEQFMEKSHGGTFTYMISKNGAFKLLSNIQSNGMNYAIDWDISRLECMNNYYMYPLLSFSQMANDLPENDSDIQSNKLNIQCSVHDWILEDIQKMLEVTNNKGILYFERDSWNEFIYNKFKFDTKTNIIISKLILNKNLLLTNICFTQIWFENSKSIQDLLTTIINENIPIYFYTIYERYLITVPESLYYKYEDLKKHFSFINKIDVENVL